MERGQSIRPGHRVHVLVPGGFLREGVIDPYGFRSLKGQREWAVRFHSGPVAWVSEDRIRSVRPSVPWCCFIDPETNLSCARAAAWRLVWEEEGIAADTDTCNRHLIELLPRHTRTDITPLEDISAVDQLAHLA